MIENPQWTEAALQLSGLISQRDGLLANKTLLHPEVRRLENKILDCRQALEQMPRYLPAADVAGPSIEPPAGRQPLPEILTPRPLESGPPSPGQNSLEHEAAVGDFQAHKVALDDAAEAYERVCLAEREALRRQYPPPAIELQLATAGRDSAAAHRAPATMPAALMVALAMAAGVGMITSGLGNDPTLDTAQQVRAILPIPVAGTIPAANPGAAEAHRRQSNPSSGFALIGCGAGLVLAGVLILLTACG
jgi:hypothetical protein